MTAIKIKFRKRKVVKEILGTEIILLASYLYFHVTNDPTIIKSTIRLAPIMPIMHMGPHCSLDTVKA